MPPPAIPNKARTEGSPDFDPQQFFTSWSKGDIGVPDTDNDFQSSIAKAFGLKSSDKYIYRATAEVTLAQAQSYLNYGDKGGLLEWYRAAPGQTEESEPPSPSDISAYTNIFASTTSTSKSLTTFASNAKRSSIRAEIAAHLNSLYAAPSSIQIPKLKTPHLNPYLDLWSWSCHALKWAGPDPDTAHTKISHALLPVLYHHFGCLVPTYESLVIIRALAKGKTVIDLGSGNGYWTYMLRRLNQGQPEKLQVPVIPVDNALSTWRTVWVGDTVVADGVKYLSSHRNGGKDDVLLLVYPQVSGDFTGKVLRAYTGNTIIVAGTQNGNGFTGFIEDTIDQWMQRELPQYQKVCQVPLPSFAGKDEALFAFVKKKIPDDT